jgi:hypothetical protein
MRSLYFQYVKHTPSISLDNQVQYLNGLVVKECVNIILTNIRQFMGFSQDAQTLPMPMPHPMNMSTIGTKLPMMPTFF